MNFILASLSRTQQKKIRIWIPELFCWEILKDFDTGVCELFFYKTNHNLQPIWDTLRNDFENVRADVLLLVSFFGIRADVAVARSFCAAHAIHLFLDNTHCVIPDVKPKHNEFVFLSPYKQFAIPSGGVVVVTADWAQQYAEKDLECYPSAGNFLGNVIWMLKSAFVLLTRSMQYVPNRYSNTIPPNQPGSADIQKGMPAYAYHELLLQLKQEPLNELKGTIDFYSSVVEITGRYFNCCGMNCHAFNSHLFGIAFTGSEDPEKVIGIFQQVLLPVVRWPEREYISALGKEQENVRSIIDQQIFLCAFPGNNISETRKKEILNKITYEFKRARDHREDDQR